MRSVTVSRIQSAAYFVLGLVAAIAGTWAYVAPGNARSAFSDRITEIDVRLVGAAGIALALALVGLSLARTWDERRLPTVMVAIWSGAALVGLLPNASKAGLRTTSMSVGVACFVACGGVSMASWLGHRKVRRHRDEASLGDTLTMGYLVLGWVLVMLGAVVLAAPGPVSERWPWNVSRVCSGVLGAAMVGCGAGSILLTRTRRWAEARLIAGTVCAFASLVLVASLAESSGFSSEEALDVLWFAMLIATVVVSSSSLIQARLWRRRT